MNRWRWIQAMVESDMPPVTRLVAHTMASFADKEGHCWPSYNAIARRSGLDRQTCFRHVASLVERRWLSKANRQSVHGQQSNSYLLITPVDNHAPIGTAPMGVEAQRLRGVGTAPTPGHRHSAYQNSLSEELPHDEPPDTAHNPHLDNVVDLIAKGMRLP